MAWRGSTDAKDRIFAALVYLLPFLEAYRFSVSLLRVIPFLSIIYVPLQPLLTLYLGFPFAGIIIFFALFLGVVRNERIKHFIRFNAMQAILIDILLVLCGLVDRFIMGGISSFLPLISETFSNVVFIATFAACIYAIVQSILGKYAEIPTISQAAYSQVR
ncbi:MAG: Tic20 family protein [Xenococcaceae cyanobacterium]